MKVSIREMKNGLSKILKYVQTGNEVIITERGKPVARLSVIDDPALDPQTQTLQRLRRMPWLRPSSGGKVKGAHKPLKWRAGDPLLSDLVREGRE
ncbi:MAG: type II toxin-antitoxin system prevent-host-death family antitoxin [Gammaproteobacteria bacterium]|nr:type II toxin-antitoxin system prevent-host-death family antitoxin [Gammaproteobacteria bacterium]